MAQGSRRPQPPDDGQPGTLGAPRRLTVIDQAGDVVVEIQDDPGLRGGHRAAAVPPRQWLVHVVSQRVGLRDQQRGVAPISR